jgi:hypothetical protein
MDPIHQLVLFCFVSIVTPMWSGYVSCDIPVLRWPAKIHYAQAGFASLKNDGL